jgi:hypothetical protein
MKNEEARVMLNEKKVMNQSTKDFRCMSCLVKRLEGRNKLLERRKQAIRKTKTILGIFKTKIENISGHSHRMSGVNLRNRCVLDLYP